MKIIDNELSDFVNEYLNFGEIIHAAESNRQRLAQQIIKRMPTDAMTIGDKNGYFARCKKTEKGLEITEVCDGK